MEQTQIVPNWTNDESSRLWNPGLTQEARTTFDRLVDQYESQNTNQQIEAKAIIWLASSGTTGAMPKVIGLTKAALLASAQSVNRYLGAEAEDRWALMLPEFHVGGLSISARAFLSKSSVDKYSGRWQVDEVYQWLCQVQPQFLSLVPTQLHDLIQRQYPAWPKLKAVLIGGADLNLGLAKNAEKLGWPIHQTFGMTETSSMIAAGPPGKMKLLPHCEALIDDEGHLHLRGDSLFSVIIDGNQSDDPVIILQASGAWWKTSDRANIKDEIFQWLGREDDFVKIKGEGIFLSKLSQRVSDFLIEQSLPYKLLAILVQEDPRSGGRLLAALEPSGANEDLELASWTIALNQELSKSEKIQAFHVRRDWPKTPLGKLKLVEALRLVTK